MWNSATWENSEALLPFLGPVMGGETAWADNPTIHRAIEVHSGVIQNPAILSFQRRDRHYPHEALAT